MRGFVRIAATSVLLAASLYSASEARFPRGTIGSPASLPLPGNLVAEWIPDSLALSNGANVTSWTDIINGSVAGTQVGTLPTFATNQANGLPAVVCGGAGGIKVASASSQLTSALTSNTYTVFIIFQNTGASSSGALLGATNMGASTAIAYWADGTYVSTLTGSADVVIPYSGQTNFSTLGAVFGSGQSIGISSWFQNVNGGTVLSQNNTPPSLSGELGICTDPNNSFPGKNKIFGIFVWNVALTPPQYLQMEIWARNKYAQATPWSSSPIQYFPVVFGDSISAGNGSGDGATGTGKGVVNSPCYLMAQTLGLSYGQWSCPSYPTISLDNLNALAPTQLDPIPAMIGKKTADVTFEWANQRDTTTTKGNIFLNARKLVPNMFTVWGTSTDLSTSPADRNTYDSAWDAAAKTNVDAYMAIHNDTHVGVNGSYNTYTLGGCPTADGIHLCAVTNPYLAAFFSSGVQALP